MIRRFPRAMGMGPPIDTRAELDKMPFLERELAEAFETHQQKRNGNIEKIKALLAAGASTETKDKYGNPLICAAANHGDKELVNILLAAGAKVDARDGCSQTGLVYAIMQNDKKMAKLLINSGADVNMKYPAFIEELRFRGRFSTSSNGLEDTALMLASYNGSLQIVKLLIKAGARVDEEDTKGMTALMWTASVIHPENMGIEKTGKRDLRDKNGKLTGCIEWTKHVYRESVKQRYLAVVSYLLSSGADAKHKNKLGKTAVAIAVDEEVKGFLM